MIPLNGIQLPVSVRTYQIRQSKLSVLYPVIVELPNLQVQQKINQTILNEVYKLLQTQGYGQNPLTESTGYYEIKSNERGIFSISLFNYSFSGGAHGLTLQRSLTSFHI